MPLFQIGENDLISFRKVPAGPDLYEKEIEGLLWDNPEAFLGVPLFPVKRQPTLSNGLKPDVVMLDDAGHVYVMEVKRHIARKQLAQCLEYAGWALDTGLDELAGMFHEGEDEFFERWTEFTDTNSPQLVQRPPRLVLVAGGFDDRTESALRFLSENGLPITVLKVTLYQDQENRRFLDIDADHEPDISVPGDGNRRKSQAFYDGRQILVSDLINEGLIKPNTRLEWNRPRIGKTYLATVLENGLIQLPGGKGAYSPSRAATEASGLQAANGWVNWQVPEPGGRTLSDLRAELVERYHSRTTDQER